MQVQEALRVIAFRLGSPAPADSELLSVLNDCGEWFLGCRPWAFLRRETYLSVPAQITFTLASWTAATKTLSHASAFLTYVGVEGDKVEITGGTGATLGYFEIDVASSTTTTLVLKTSIAAGNLGAVVAGTLHVSGRTALPADMGSIEPGYPTLATGFGQSFEMTDSAKVHEWRAYFTGGGGSRSYIGAVVWGRKLAGGAPVPRLEIAPEIVEGRDSAFVLVYRGKWIRVSTATGEFELPSFCEPAFKEALRQFALGTYEADEGTIDARLANFVSGATMGQAIAQDMSTQDDFGRIEGGAVAIVTERGPFQNFDIQNPS